MAKQTGDLVFHNGTVFDGADFLPPGTAVRISDGRVVTVGEADVLGSAEPVDLAGGTLLPGFIDAHAHPVFAGNQLRHCDLRSTVDADEYVALVADYARTHPDEE